MMLKLLKQVKELGFPEDQYAVFGSGPMAVRNLRAPIDIDLIVKSGIWKNLENKYPVIKDKVIRIGSIEIYKDWKPWFNDVNLLIDTADTYDGIRFVKLEYLCKWKREMNREKDRADLKIIADFLKAANSSVV